MCRRPATAAASMLLNIHLYEDGRCRDGEKENSALRRFIACERVVSCKMIAWKLETLSALFIFFMNVSKYVCPCRNNAGLSNLTQSKSLPCGVEPCTYFQGWDISRPRTAKLARQEPARPASVWVTTYCAYFELCPPKVGSVFERRVTVTHPPHLPFHLHTYECAPRLLVDFVESGNVF